MSKTPFDDLYNALCDAITISLTYQEQRDQLLVQLKNIIGLPHAAVQEQVHKGAQAVVDHIEEQIRRQS